MKMKVVNKMKLPGGWIRNRQEKFKPDTKIKVKCWCGKQFTATKDKNLEVEKLEAYSHIVDNELDYKPWLECHRWTRCAYDIINKYFSVCPNCKATAYLFSEETGEKRIKIEYY